MATLKYWLWLTTRRGMGPAHAFQVLEHFGTPEGVFFADPAEYELVEGLSLNAKQSLEQKSLDGAERILGECDRLGLRILTIGDAEYPDRLKNIYDPPLVLYVRGKLFHFDSEVAIGMVGARHPSEYGVRMAGKLGLELARAGALVISGIAEGLDAAALVGALKGGGPVVSVLGGGADVIYPWQNRYLYEDVAAAGALISEYPPGTETIGKHFPVRNRIISGLSLGVLAVECAVHSGTMITIGCALEQNREIFAIPGNVDAPMSAGTNLLIQQGALLVTCGQDIMQEYESRFPEKVHHPQALNPQTLGARLTSERIKTPPAEPVSDKKEVDKAPNRAYIDLSINREALTDDQRDLLIALGERFRTADDLVEETQIPAKRVLTALTLLQVLGYVSEQPGKRFERTVELILDHKD